MSVIGAVQLNSGRSVGKSAAYLKRFCFSGPIQSDDVYPFLHALSRAVEKDQAELSSLPGLFSRFQLPAGGFAGNGQMTGFRFGGKLDGSHGKRSVQPESESVFFESVFRFSMGADHGCAVLSGSQQIFRFASEEYLHQQEYRQYE